MKKFVYFLMFCLAFNLSFSIGYIDDANKLNDLTNVIVGKLNKSEWEVSLKAARKIYYWTKNNIQYDYEKDKKILEGKNFSIKSPYQTFLTRKGNSYEIALLDLVLLYNTGLFNTNNIRMEKNYAEGTVFGSFQAKNNNQLISGFLSSFSNNINLNCSKYKNYFDVIECKKTKQMLLNFSITLKKFRYLFFGSIIFNNTHKIKAILTFDTYLEPYCAGYKEASLFEGKMEMFYFIGCGNSRTLMILDPEYGIFTLPNYVKFLERKYNKTAKYLVLYSVDLYKNKFKQIYLITFSYKRFYLPFIINYNNVSFDYWWKLYYLNHLVWPPQIAIPMIWRTIKTFYPAPYNQLNETLVKEMEEKYGVKI